MMKERIVIKLGGSSLQNPETLQQLASLVRGYQKRRYRVVIVHGGGPAINEELMKQKIEWQFIDGQRQTTPQMMRVIDDVLANKVNASLVEKLKQEKIAAVGISAAESQILFCSPAREDLMLVGHVEDVNVAAIEQLLAQFGAKVPVIAPIGFGKGEEKYNVNADWAATKIAVALKAKKLIFLTDQSGILNHEKQLVAKATPQMIDQMIEDGTISGGMYTKVKAMMTALNAGIKQVRVLHASFASLVLNAGHIGTLLTSVHSNRELTRGVLHGRAS
jgi:acetylglutamate kinase